MLIVPLALHCVDSCIFVFTSFDTVCCFGFSARPLPLPPPPPPHHPSPNFFIRFSFFVKIHLLESSQLESYDYPPPTPSFPIFYQISFGPVFTASTSPDKGHTVRNITELRAYFAPLAVLLFVIASVYQRLSALVL